MSREKYIDDYEDFEPEISIWPFLLLSFLLPLVPFIMNIVLGRDGFSFFLAAEYAVTFLPLFSTALSMKDGEKAWTFLLSSASYFFLILIQWASLKIKENSGYVLGIPFATAISPISLSLIAFTFFNKRRRNNWLGWAVVGCALSLLLTYLTYSETKSLLNTCYPALVLLLSLLIFFVTRRTESTPWYIVTVLVLLTISSFTLYPSFSDVLLSSSTAEVKLSALIKAFLFSFPFWYTLSFLFVFAGLAGKSSYRKERIEENEEETENIVVPPLNESNRMNTSYTNPPQYSRFNPAPSEEPVRRSEPPKEEERNTREEVKDDKWYNFIEGGVREGDSQGRRNRYEDERDYRRDDRERIRDDRDYRRDDRDYRRDERDYPRDERDYRRRDDYLRDDRDYRRDDRDYRRDERDYRRDERDYRRDDRDYRRGYYDDDYPPYDDRRR